MAEYGLIAELVSLCTARSRLGEKLRRAEELILAGTVADECSVYLLDSESGAFVIGSEGGSGRIESYGPGEGLPGLLGDKADSAHTESAGKGVADAGLEGFGAASVFALKNAERLYGLLYLKFRERTSAQSLEGAFIDTVVAHLTLILAFNELSGSSAGYKDRLKSAEKLACLGDMAATLAHEIKNPLVSIGGFASRLARKLGPDSEHSVCVSQILVEIQRLEKLLNGVTSFIKDVPLELVADDLNEIIEEALALFDEEFSKHKIEVVREFSRGRLEVKAEREELKIAFDNLIANAIQSMDTGGILTISTAVHEGYAVATVGDTGCGIDSAHAENIFNPFFTTKECGTGLGLSITNSIIARHNGSVEVVAGGGKGAVFAVKLPLPS